MKADSEDSNSDDEEQLAVTSNEVLAIAATLTMAEMMKLVEIMVLQNNTVADILILKGLLNTIIEDREDQEQQQAQEMAAAITSSATAAATSPANLTPEQLRSKALEEPRQKVSKL